MIARAPQPTRNMILSSRLGLVSIPGANPELSSAGPGAEGFDRDEGIFLLQALGGCLGLTLLESAPEVFPETDSPAADASPAGSPAVFPLDEAVRKALEGLDAVWMDGTDVVAAFVLAPRPGGWEGLRRLADLLALHPKLKAPLYVVTMPALHAGIVEEIHRPAYRLLKKPLAETLRLLPWERLKTEVAQLGERVRYLKPEFLDGIADRVAPPAAD